MMNTKINTKTWTNHADAQPVSQTTKLKLNSASDKSEAARDLGQVLNEIADPKYVDPAKMRKPQGKLDKDAFLKLMLTQLKYQDPMNPMQSHEMAAQLAQFSSLEQLSNINDSVKGLKKAQDPMMNFQALNFLGKTISSNTEKILRTKGDTTHDLRFQLAQAAKQVTIKVKDETGAVIKNITVANLKRGENKVIWNGTKEDGYPAYAGNYTFSVEGIGENGAKIGGRTSYSGTVTGLNFTAEGPVLMIGDQKVRLSDVKKIEDPSERAALDAKDAAIANPVMAAVAPAAVPMPVAPGAVPSPATPAAATAVPTLPQAPHAAVTPAPQVKSKSAEQAEVAPAEEKPKGNIDMVPMSDQFRNVLTKETKS